MLTKYTHRKNFGNSSGLGYFVHVAQENTPVPVCAVDFWTFAVPVILGTVASQGIGLIAKRLFNNEHANTQEAARTASQIGAFWLIAGFAWIVMSKRKGVSV